MAAVPPQEGTPSGAAEQGSSLPDASGPDPADPSSPAPDPREPGLREPGLREPGLREPGLREPGLRERKKARTRAAIRQHAYRLFASQGYDQTTVEQIAAAAEVSASTFFRYFPSKEALVLLSDYEPLLVGALRSLPTGMPPGHAVRKAVRTAFESLPADALARYRQRVRLAMSVLELRAAWLASMTQSGIMIAELLSVRTGRPVDDPAIRFYVGALGGVWVEVVRHWVAHPDRDIVADMDAGLAFLEAGLPLT